MVTRTTQEAAINNSQTQNPSFQDALVDNLYYTQGAAIASAGAYDYYMALSGAVRRKLLERWRATTEAYYAANPKFVYYLSAEYMLGKQLPQNLVYTGLTDQAIAALDTHNLTLDECMAEDPEPGLGNGGLGRLAACYLDSLATLNIPAVGYGIRYEYGIFRQHFEDGWQAESSDEWALREYPWELRHSDNMVEVHYGGHTEPYTDEHGRYRVRWVHSQTVRGEPYYILVPGYGTTTVNMLRLWRARAARRFDFALFNTGDYLRAVEEKSLSESISKVLYPNDNTPQGRELRLKQQYFFVACSLHDIVRRFHIRNADWSEFPRKVVMQLNDTHPVIAIPELMRVLLDEHDLGWDQAWAITVASFAYTCHTLLPEALETWPVELFHRLLPRHLEIVYEINRRFLDEVRARFPGDEARARRMSIIDEDNGRHVRMAHLAAVGTFAINGVAEIQSRLLQDRTLRDFGEMWPGKFQNKTNGVTPRRFIKMANPQLADLISGQLGDGWLTDLEQLRGLEPLAGDAGFRSAWRDVKRKNKEDLAAYALRRNGIALDPDSMFDVMVKRLHEYKRQLLKALHIVTLYHRVKDNPALDIAPRTFVFGAKAAPGYAAAKRIIKLINNIGDVVNHDADVAGRLNVVFLENFNVTLAQRIYPAADLSEQISLAGKEASGTGNMKFALNGAVTIGTLDGANIEIRDLVGADNFFLFGLTVDDVFRLRERGYRPSDYYHDDAELRRCLDSIADGTFSRGDTALFRPIVDTLLGHDEFMLLADYRAYVDCQSQVDRAYGDVDAWTRMSILNTARCGFFSSDRAIRQYCRDIWQAEPVRVL
jgi:starch phosphorylase